MTRWDDAELDRWRTVGDPEADAVVAALFADHDVARANDLLHTLVRDDAPAPAGLPPELVAYLSATVALPTWADPHRIERAERFFQLWGLQISVSLFCASLPSSYAAADGVKVLYRTARLDTDTKRRVMETGQFLLDVLAPGGLGPHGKGRRAVQRVRLMHAAVRHLIEARAAAVPGSWDPAWGRPINQEDLAGTLLAFSYVVGEPLPRLGLEADPADVDAYLHTWNVVGHLLGVAPELQVHDLAEARELVTAIRRRQYAASPEGTELAAALVELLEHLAELPRAGRVVPALIRHLIGDGPADLIGIPEGAAPHGHLAHLVEALAHHAEDLVEDDAPLHRLVEPFGRALLHGLFLAERGGVRAPFAMPTALARAWELTPG